MNRRTLDRRRFLKLMGASALTYPLLRGLPSYAAGEGGASAADPVYLVLLFTSCGTVRYRWGAEGPAPTTTAPTVTSPLAFRQTLSAFAKAGPMQVDLTDKVTVLDGLQVKAAGGGSHEAGMAALWTGLTTSGGPATGPSIDAVISAGLKAPTPYANVPLMVQSSADYAQRQVDTRMLYDESGSFVDPYTSPSAALAALFPSAATSGGAAGGDKKAFIRKKVAAQLNQDSTAIQARLCTEDRQQLQNLQAIWNQVQTQLQNAARAASQCTAPAAASAGDAGSSTDPFPTYAEAMPNILAMTLACDLTRVASLQFSHALSPVTHTWLGSSQTSTHHIYSHQGPTWLGALGADPYSEPASTTSQYPQQLVDIETWYAQKVASVAYTLSQLKTASGKNLLDQTVLCWGSEIRHGSGAQSRQHAFRSRRERRRPHQDQPARSVSRDLRAERAEQRLGHPLSQRSADDPRTGDGRQPSGGNVRDTQLLHGANQGDSGVVAERAMISKGALLSLIVGTGCAGAPAPLGPTTSPSDASATPVDSAPGELAADAAGDDAAYAATYASTGESGTPLALSDGFESAAVGGPPASALWSVASPDCAGSGTLAVDGTQSHGGQHSVRVSGGPGYCDHVFFANARALASLESQVYARFFVRLGSPLGTGHVTLLAMKDASDAGGGGGDLRMGGQDMVLMYNRQSDDATLPVLSPAGVALSVVLPDKAWVCIELHVDESAGTIDTWVDGREVPGLIEDGTSVPDVSTQWLSRPGWRPVLSDFRLGWESYSGQAMTLWIDDVALAAQRVGCATDVSGDGG